MTHYIKQDLTEPSLQELLDKVNSGAISFAEFHRISQERQAARFAPQLFEHYTKKEWRDFITLSLSVWELMPTAFRYFDEIPDEFKYQYAVDAYVHHGDSIPAVRAALRKARKFGAPALPPEISQRDTITIYRAGEEPITKCKYRISWTLDKNVAKFFLNEYIGKHANFLYMGKIKPQDIIAYTDERKEKEVLQYGKVFDIEIIDHAI